MAARNGKFAAVGTLVASVGVLFATVGLQAATAANAVQIGQLEDELTVLSRDYRRAVTDLERAHRPAELREAAADLGLVPPEPGQLVVQ